MKRLLIVTADDVGLHRGMTAGAIRTHREGIVTACSVMANGPEFDDAVERLREVPTLEVGVHLEFAESYLSFLPRYLARVIGIDAIERSLRAQIEKVLKSGLHVTHFNGHQHLHLLPRIFTLVKRLADEYKIGYIRIVDDHGGRARRVPMAVLSTLGRRSSAPNTNDRTIGVAGAGHHTDLVPLLDHVEGVTELVMHPGLGVTGFDWGYDWEGEVRALCDPRLRNEIAAREITLTAPSRI